VLAFRKVDESTQLRTSNKYASFVYDIVIVGEDSKLLPHARHDAKVIERQYHAMHRAYSAVITMQRSRL